MALSYALFLAAYMFLGPYIIFLIVFAVGDIITISKKSYFNLKKIFLALRPQKNDWPILIVLIFLIWFSARQSPHPWNNAWFSKAEWFPVDGKNLSQASFIQSYNWYYIFYKYGTFKDKDIYFTNQEAFAGAKDTMGVIRANPKFVAAQFIRHIKNNFLTITSFTKLPLFFYTKIAQTGYFYYLIFLFFTVPYVLFIFYGALRGCQDKFMLLFVIANILVIFANAAVTAKARYMHPLIPILALSAFWYANRLAQRYSLAKNFAFFLTFFFLSNSLTTWAQIANEVIADTRKNKIKVMERRDHSYKATFKTIQSLTQGSKGVLSFDHLFLGAFINIPLERLYDIWEIPPFGRLGFSDYQGLRPDRIDCILVSHELATGTGFATNYQLRYQNYIKPYAEELKAKGAIVYNLKPYGQAILLTGREE